MCVCFTKRTDIVACFAGAEKLFEGSRLLSVIRDRAGEATRSHFETDWAVNYVARLASTLGIISHFSRHPLCH